MLIQNGSGVTQSESHFQLDTVKSGSSPGTTLCILLLEALKADRCRFESPNPVNMPGMVGVEKKQ